MSVEQIVSGAASAVILLGVLALAAHRIIRLVDRIKR